MRPFEITIPKLAFVAGTRGLLGVGVGLLVAGHLSATRRKQLGLALLSIGALTTIPIAAKLISSQRSPAYPALGNER